MSGYEQLEPIQTLDELVAQEFVIMHQKVYHQGWVRSWQLNWILERIRQGQLYTCRKIGTTTPSGERVFEFDDPAEGQIDADRVREKVEQEVEKLGNQCSNYCGGAYGSKV